MPIEITEDDICGYDEGNIEAGGTIVYESNGKVQDKIKEMRDVKTYTNQNTLDDDTKDTLLRIEQELLQLNIQDKSSEQYRRTYDLYRKISKAYNKNNDDLKSDKEDSVKEEDINDKMTDFSFNYHDIQRLTKLEQNLSLLEEAVGFNSDQEEDMAPNIISRINKLYSHLKLIKNELSEEQSHTLEIIQTPTDNNENTVKSYEYINKYSPYMDHIITRLENYSSLYDGMIENNLRLQEWDEKMDIIIRQQNRWIELLDQIDAKLDKR